MTITFALIEGCEGKSLTSMSVGFGGQHLYLGKNRVAMKTNTDKAPAGAQPKQSVKPSKTQEYVKKTFKNNWSNTKSVYTRPR